MNPKAQRALELVAEQPIASERVPGEAAAAAVQPAQLPSGRHGLPRRFVVRHQRERIQDAVTRVVAREGYAQATVAQIVLEARLSRRTLYEHFEDKEACFLAAYDAAVARIADVVGVAYRGPGDWVERMRDGLEAFVRLMVAEPELARLCLVEVVAAGPEALRHRERAMEMFAGAVGKLGGRQAPDGVEVPPLAAELVVGGLSEIVRARVLKGRVETLLEELPQMMYCVLVPFCGHREASAVAERVAADGSRAGVDSTPPGS